MAVSVRVSVDGAAVVEQRFDDMQANATDLEAAGAWFDVSQILSEGLDELFEAQGQFGAAQRWSRLAPTTVKQRARAHLTPIRVGWATGRMAQSLIETTHPEAIEVADGNTYIRGTAVNNEGVSYPGVFVRGREGRQPARSIFRRLFGDVPFVNRILRAIGRRIMGEDDGQ